MIHTSLVAWSSGCFGLTFIFVKSVDRMLLENQIRLKCLIGMKVSEMFQNHSLFYKNLWVIIIRFLFFACELNFHLSIIIIIAIIIIILCLLFFLLIFQWFIQSKFDAIQSKVLIHLMDKGLFMSLTIYNVIGFVLWRGETVGIIKKIYGSHDFSIRFRLVLFLHQFWLVFSI